eukprot:contig_18532_g4556
MAAPHQPPAADGESGESQKPDLMELNRDQLMACSSCSSFAELVGAVGPVRSAGTDLEWASALAGNPGTPPLIVDTTEEVRKVMETLMEVVGGDYDNETAKDAALKLRMDEASLVTDDEVCFTFAGLVHLRLVFMHHADLSAIGVASHFKRFVTAVKLAVRSGRLSNARLELDAVAILQAGAYSNSPDQLPIILMDEVGRTNDTAQDACRSLIKYIEERPTLYTVEGELHEPTTLLLSGACNLAQEAGGNVITTYVSSSLAAWSSTLSGRRVTPVEGISNRDPLAFCDLFSDCLVTMAVKSGFYVVLDGAQSPTRVVLKALVHGRTAVQEARTADKVYAAVDEMMLAVRPVAEGLCFCAGVHTRTVVHFRTELLRYARRRKPVPLRTVLQVVSTKLLLSEALNVWTSASAYEQDNLLTVLILGEQVSWQDVCFPKRLDPQTQKTVQKAILFDRARRCGLVVGDGDRFKPRIPAVTLYLMMQHAKSSAFYDVLEKELDGSEPKPLETARDVPWMRWEDCFMRIQVAQSVARSLRAIKFRSTSLAAILARGGAVHCGAGPLLHAVMVDASTPRTQILRRDLTAILSSSGPDADQERATTIYQLPLGTPGADAVMFYRIAGSDEWVMVLQQFKYFRLEAATVLAPGNVVGDWEKLPTDALMGRKLFKLWKGRIVYLNAAFREHTGFPAKLRSEDGDVDDVCDIHSVVLTRSGMRATVGSTFNDYIQAMDWIHCASLEPF